MDEDQGPVDLGPAEHDFDVPTEGNVYNPDKDRERTRSVLALRVLWLLVAVVAALLGAVISGLREWNELEGLSASVLPGVLTVVGTVLGFYFGSTKRGGKR